MQKPAECTTVRLRLPSWLPKAARLYLAHTEAGIPIRGLARDAGCHPSTVLRRIRHWETRRDDVLVDTALRRLGVAVTPMEEGFGAYGMDEMSHQKEDITAKDGAGILSEAELRQDARRILGRLCEPGSVLAVAEGMKNAVVVRETEDSDGPVRIAAVSREAAEAMAVKGWIACRMPGRISRYAITRSGRSELNILTAESENRATGLAEAPAHFEAAQRTGVLQTAFGKAGEGARGRTRYGVMESPLVALARRRDRDGRLFLSEPLVRAGERLREDFELAEMACGDTGDWEAVLAGEMDWSDGEDAPGSAAAARGRVIAALSELGPGLGDIALRCCCHLVGLEQAEKDMGWSARSAKIVLRIALQRLRRHYEGLGEDGGLIGG